MDRDYYERLLQAVSATYGEDLQDQEREWDTMDDFMRTEFLAVDVVDAERRLGILEDAAKSGALPPDLLPALERVKEMALAAQPRIEVLQERRAARQEQAAAVQMGFDRQ